MSELSRFGFHGDGDDARWKAAVEKFLTALVTNPHLNIGDTNSEVRFPPQPPAGRGGGDTTITAGALTGAFCHLYTIADGAGAGDIYLQGGTITGSNGGSAVIADYKVEDAADTPPLSDAGDKLYLSCNVTATLANGIVQPGVLLNSAVLTKTLPTAHTFSTGALTGVVFREIGRWTDTEFLPSGACGISTVTGCPGSFAIV